MNFAPKSDSDNSVVRGVMADGMRVDKLEAKSHDSPDEVRTPDKTRVEVVRLGEATIGRFIFQPGWRWSECQLAHRAGIHTT